VDSPEGKGAARPGVSRPGPARWMDRYPSVAETAAAADTQAAVVVDATNP